MKADQDITSDRLQEAKAKQLRAAQRRYRRDLTHNYHQYLAPVVTWATPLLLDLCEVRGLDLEVILRRLRPPAGWPYPIRGRIANRARGAHLLGTVAIEDGVQVVVRNDTLDVRTWVGEGFACTRNGELQLWLLDQIPETVNANLPGRELASVVEHPLFRMRPYRIIYSESVGNGTVINIEAPLTRYKLPWA